MTQKAGELCIKCLDERPHPWHDDGTWNHEEDRYGPGGDLAPPFHTTEDDDE